MTLSGEGLVILGIIITMMLADMLYNGARIVLDQRVAGEAVAFSAAEPVASVWALGLQSTGNGTLKFLMHAGFWSHSAFVLIFLNILPYSKHFHIITAIRNVFTRNPSANKLPTIDGPRGQGRARRADRPREDQGPDLEGRARLLHVHRVRPLLRQLPGVHDRQEALAQAPHARAARPPVRRASRADRARDATSRGCKRRRAKAARRRRDAPRRPAEGRVLRGRPRGRSGAERHPPGRALGLHDAAAPAKSSAR